MIKQKLNDDSPTENPMTRMMLTMFTTLIFIVAGGVDGMAQSKKEPTVWFVDMTPNNFRDFYNPFLKTIKNLRLGNRLRIHSDWDRVWSDTYFSPREGDIYVMLIAKENPDAIVGGFVYSINAGIMDGCKNWTLGYTNTGVSYGASLEYVLSTAGYEFGNETIEYINKQLGK